MLNVLASSCTQADLVAPPGPTLGAIRVIVKSFSGLGVDPAKVGVGVHATSIGTTQTWEGGETGIESPGTLRLPVGTWEVRTAAGTSELGRLGFPAYCDAIPDVETVTIVEAATIVLERSVSCVLPAALDVRTSVTGIAPWQILKLQFAAGPGVCDLAELPDPDDPVLFNPDVFRIYAMDGSLRLSPLRPGMYTLNLCGLPPGCPSQEQSHSFHAREDELSEVIFALRCES